ncbi:MAG: hypothetical protein WAP55_01890 [Minisyncoccia bacterium]
MAIFVPNENIEKNQSYGQAINRAVKEFIEPELKRLSLKNFNVAGVEIMPDGNRRISFDSSVQIMLEFKSRKLSPNDTGKPIKIDLQELKDVKWHDPTLGKESARILVVRFSKDWWIWDADFKKMKDLENRFKFTTTHKVRGGGYLPLTIRKQEKGEFLRGWKMGLEKELPAMWRRHITVSQRYRGVMVYDGNYFDLFSHAQELYVLGYYYSTIIVCRTAAEQALVRILLKVGKGFDIYKRAKGRKKLKSIEQLVETCRSYSLFRGKYPISKISAKKINNISTTASELIHPKHDLHELDVYKKQAERCMDNLQFIISRHLNFIKDTGVVSGYRLGGSAHRLR